MEHRLERNRLKGVAGDAIHAILSAAAMNFHQLLGAFWRIFLRCLLAIWDAFHKMTPPEAFQDQPLRAGKRLFQERLVSAASVIEENGQY